jgi:ATP-dependent HslUV protease ATP-binding subunit HslU
VKTTNFTPREIVSELDRYIIGQGKAKKSVAIALRNRWRRQQVQQPLRDEIVPKNIIMIGPTGVGKTEIARRLARLAKAPFIKVEASKFTEVGYVGKDVESMIRELTDIAVNQVRDEETRRVRVRAQEIAEERLLDMLLPQEPPEKEIDFPDIDEVEKVPLPKKAKDDTRAKLRKLLREGKLDDRTLEIEPAAKAPAMPGIEVVAAGSIEEMGSNLRDMFSNMFQPGGRKKRKIKVPEALEMITEEEAARLVDMEGVIKDAVERVEQNGIVFLDEIDKIAGSDAGGRQGPDVSRQGVQRDILPIIEGSQVMTKHGMVRTDHILFIAAGAFHMTKPSDLIPELQGRFPIRVELDSLTKDDFYRILTEPENSLTKQYVAMMETEGMKLSFDKGALMEVCDVASQVNAEMENIGARRLHTVMETLLESLSFEAPEKGKQTVKIDKKYVDQQLAEIVKDRDLRRYIL